jgi:hypothetical protein
LRRNDRLHLARRCSRFRKILAGLHSSPQCTALERSFHLESSTGTQATLDLLGARQTEVSIGRIAYHGWSESYLISNGVVEAVVVPAIGRVMQFRLAGEDDGAFWENRALDGQLHEPHSSEWINFGGDKCWPAPQSEWIRQQNREWPPPVGFDSSPVEAVVTERGVVLTSPVDPAFGIQVVRQVELDAEAPVMRVKTTYRKMAGSPVTVGVWSITQMQEPERVFLPLQAESAMRGGFVRLIDTEPESLQTQGNLLSFVRHPYAFTKIGSDAASMVWVGRKLVVRIDAETGPGEYPDSGCVTEVYTNPDPMPYIELETLGPLATMRAGDRIARTATYTIMPRSAEDPEAEARKILDY